VDLPATRSAPVVTSDRSPLSLASHITEFRILGPLEVADGGAALPLAGGKARALLARLLLDVNRTVSVDAIVDSLWGEDVPASAIKMVHVYVSQLRKVLPDGVLRTRAPGYVLEVAPEAVDLAQFTRLRAEGRAALSEGDAEAAAARLRAGLALWRGAALAEFSEPFAATQAAHLEELHVACTEDRIDADLALGHHADLVGELRVHTADHPLRERLRCQLMLALYRAGRQAEALAVYHEFRAMLLAELAMEPSSALVDLQHKILNQDPSLDLAAPPVSRVEPLHVTADDDAERFVGRTAELHRLERAFEAATAGRGTTALVTGPAGIGKTRLVEQLTERARGDGATVLSGRCIDLVGAGLPYLPLVEALRPLCGSPWLDGLRGELRELPRLHPDLHPDFLGCTAHPAGDPAESRARLFAEVLAILEHLSHGAPLVLVLEDLHWADGSTLDLFAYLAHAIQERRILVVGTYRSDALHPEHEVHRLGVGLRRERSTVAVEVGPLGDEDLEAIVAASTDDELSAELTAAVCTRSEGNPFFAAELAAAAARGEHELPPALNDLLVAAVARLGADTRSLLRVIAAAGRDVPSALLTAVMALPEPAIPEALRQAVEHHVLVADRARGSFRFRHALLAEAVYATLLPGEREEVHARLASALADDPSLAASRAINGELAQHWVAARRPVPALAASLEAARDAQAMSSLDVALRHLEQVLVLWDDVPTAEDLAGLALPAVLAWAEELAVMASRGGDEIDPRALAGILGVGEEACADRVAERLGVTTDVAAATLEMLEREGVFEAAGDGSYRPARLAVSEARELYPLAVALESIAVRQSLSLDASAVEAMRAANERMRAATHDPSAAIIADDDFHVALTAGCDNERLLQALRRVKRALLRYERLYMLNPARVERSVAQHDAILEALECGDHGLAAQRVRENLTGGLPDLAAAMS
jgi:DNA-binding SARP family transcriptional activator/DNA-binding GntR family transcriptional regulator